MNLRFDTSLAQGYKSASQIARVLTEDWLARNMYCPICGEVSIKKYCCPIKHISPLYKDGYPCKSTK
jgi:hypothetical protein